jgi:membrane protease YdiL (CAAX protease family)
MPPTPRAPREAWLPRPHPQALRGPRHRWWRPLAGLGVVLGCAVVMVLAVAVVTGALDAAGVIDLDDHAGYDRWVVGPWGLLVTNLGLAAFIPVAFLAVLAGHRWPPGYLSSVLGRLRWRWLLLVAGVAVAIWLPVNLVLVAVDPEPLDPEPRWLLLAGVVLLTTPLQAAGEEYFFRGWLTQAIGSLIPRALVGALVAGAVSATLFAFAHGEQDPWLFADRFVFGVVASWLAWRTGGLEASIAVHAVNNLVAFGFAIAFGQVEESLTITETDPVFAVVDIATLIVAGLVVDRLARRRRLTRTVPPGWPPRQRAGQQAAYQAGPVTPVGP